MEDLLDPFVVMSDACHPPTEPTSLPDSVSSSPSLMSTWPPSFCQLYFNTTLCPHVMTPCLSGYLRPPHDTANGEKNPQQGFSFI